MTVFIALLRAVNVGGTGKLPMHELKKLCEDAGFSQVRTYIASGNVVFESKRAAAAIKATLETRLEKHIGKRVAVLVRTAAEMAQVLDSNPFPKQAPNRTVAIFLDAEPPADTLRTITGRHAEEVRTGKREIYVFYGDRMADSKLKIPAATAGTARNMNTVARLIELSNSIDRPAR